VIPSIKKILPLSLSSPARDCVVLREKGRHSGGSRNPVFDFIQFFKTLDARFRWHDELRHSLRGERVDILKFRKNSFPWMGEGKDGGEL
jgi:hypothetical protein